jgi:hypothetical protein
MTKLDVAAGLLRAVGGLIGARRYRPVRPGRDGGLHFGETSVASRLVYGLVGPSAVYVVGSFQPGNGGHRRTGCVPATLG